MAFPEILAPAGSFDALTAAVRCGADAVYIGGKNYSARQSAENFDIDEIERAARLCHLHGAKLHVTVNTIILDEEIKGFCEFIKAAAKAGADAFIVQDIGAADIIRKILPDIQIHTSTQMTIHTANGALWAKEHGFCRVVAARELSREEIKPLIACGIEVEQFVHGALCMSVSGQCYMSALIGSRSANRGRCAQACRLPFSACGKSGVCALSLKDLSLADHMESLMEDGVASLKIEGRMKRPEYVAAAVTALCQARAGEKPDTDSLRAVFSRSGFTDGYYTGERNNMFGVREKEDVVSAAAVLPKLQELYRKESHTVGIDISAKLMADTPFTITATDSDGNTVTVCGDIPVPAKNRPSDEEQLVKLLSKLGDTIYYINSTDISCDGVSMLPASSVNALRRELTAKLDEARIKKNTPPCRITYYDPEKNITGKAEKQGSPVLRFRVRTKAQLDAICLSDNEECIIPFGLAENVLPADNIIIDAPRFVPDEAAFTEKCRQLYDKGFRRLMCENPAHIRIGKKLGFNLCGGMDLHTVNSHDTRILAEEGLCDVLLSPELTLKQAGKIRSDIPVGIYAYGRIPVMLVRCCPIKNEVGCKKCTKHITDRTKRDFPVICGKNYTEIMNSVPVWTADRMDELSCSDYILIDFTSENNADEIKAVSDAYRCRGSYKPSQFTRGLLYRGIESLKKG